MSDEAASARLRARIPALDLAYARFNARKTVATAAPSEFRVERIGDAIATFDPAREDGYYQRVIGLGGSDAAVAREALARYGRDGAVRMDLRGDPEPELGDALLAAGLLPAAPLLYLGAELPRGGAPSRATDGAVTVERWTNDRADEFLDLLQHEVGPIAGEIREARRPFFGTDTFRVFVAAVDGERAGWATSFVAENAAFLGNAFTRPELRRRGAQGALVRARLRDAERMGVDCAITDVSPDTESARNAQRAGLRPIARFAVWERAAAAAPPAAP